MKTKIAIVVLIFTGLIFINIRDRNIKAEEFSKPVVLEESPHKIKFDSACILISNFLQKEKLRNLADSFAIGGTIPVVSLDEMKTEIQKDFEKSMDVKIALTDIDVLNFFPCYDKSISERVFLCTTPHLVKSTDKCGCFFQPGIKPYKLKSYFDYKSGNVGKDDVKNFIKEQEVTINSDIDPVDSSKVKNWAAEFKKEFRVDPAIELNKSICGYFNRIDYTYMVKQEVDSLHKKPIAVNYFFGYDSDKKDNKLRLILIPVYYNGSKNKNLIYAKGTTEAFMMEKAWPPDDCDPTKLH